MKVLLGNNFPGFKATYEIDRTPYVDSIFTLHLGLKEIAGVNHLLIKNKLSLWDRSFRGKDFLDRLDL